MKQKFLLACAIAALLLPTAIKAQDEPKKPVDPATQPDRQKLREQLRNMTPEERQAKLRELREQGVLPANAQAQGLARRQFPNGAQPGMAGVGPGNLGAVMAVLTPEQRQSYLEASRANQEKTRALEEQAREARKAALEAGIASKLDEEALRKKLDAAAKIETELAVLRAHTLAKMEPPLSEEQIKQIKDGPLGGNMPARFPGQRPGQGPDSMQGEHLPYGNQPLPPPTEGAAPRNGPPPEKP
ncbi:MAG: hypothetical protein RLY20_2573 [Verrucomicrobiota bacterium]|jgi:Spy/CpxP family protein refolding chaperone